MRVPQEYLMGMQCGGLFALDAQKPKVLVYRFDQLVDGGSYTFQCSNEDFDRVLREVGYVKQSQEDEFARALTDYLQGAEPDQVRVMRAQRLAGE